MSFELRLGEKQWFGFDWTDYLNEGVTVANSVWSVEPPTGADLEDEGIATPKTSVFVEINAPGTYRLINETVMSDTSEGYRDMLISVPAVSTSAYMLPGAVQARLWGRYGIDALPTLGDVEIASSELDAQGPFKGNKESESQERQWPRIPSDGIGPAVTPEAVLDWVALRSYQLTTDEGPAVQSEGAGGVSVTYADPKISQTERRMERLLTPYRNPDSGFWTLDVASSFEATR